MRASAAAGRPEVGLVGRDDALARVVALRTSAGDGSLAVVVVEGEAGIGKTVLAEAATRAAADAALTSQETRVALLVARGLTNREVAASLVPQPEDRRASSRVRAAQARPSVAY